MEEPLVLSDIVRLNVKLLAVFGYFRPKFPENKLLSSISYQFYAWSFVGSFYIANISSELANMYVVLGDIEQMTNASFLLLTHLVQVPKMIFLNLYYERVWTLINSIDCAEFQPKNLRQKSHLKNDIWMSKLITKVFLWMCVATCLLWGFFPFIDKKEDGRIALPLSGWYPFPTDSSPVFELTYLYQVASSMVNGLGNICIDTLFSGLIMVVPGQLFLLNDSLRNIKDLAGKNQQPQAVQKAMDQALFDCIVHHKCILDFAKEFTDLFTVAILGQFVVSVVIICITMFQITLVPLVSIQFLSLALYQSCMLLEIFLVCYYGNEAILQSTQLTESAYCCDWTACSMTFKQNLLYFMTRSQKSLKLYAGGFFVLSLETFVTILKSSWSYFAVLNRVHNK